MEVINNSHSSIIDIPIDYNTFPLAKKASFFKFEITENDCISIPKNWFHCIITEPKTLSIHYEIKNINFINNDNDFYKSFIYSEPFVKYFTNNQKNNITYDEFINCSLDFNYMAIISNTYDCSPVIKNNTYKTSYNTTLHNIINITNSHKYYTYVGSNVIHKNHKLNKYNDISFIIPNDIYDHIYYYPTIWFSFDNTINSGLHHDPTHNLIYILSGKKTIYLAPPDNKDFLYIQNFIQI